MKKIILIAVTGFIFFAAFYFFVKGPEKKLLTVWRFLQKDVLYLNDNEVIRGWIWQEDEEIIYGETETQEIFNVTRSDCKKIYRNALFEYLRNLI
ncbi:MAG: hypothetical protein JW734_02815 [Candidatus Omnitrophica bacterium]|nr:hypothetical protein [Candidatus Omnitrophota bacterium]